MELWKQGSIQLAGYQQVVLIYSAPARSRTSSDLVRSTRRPMSRATRRSSRLPKSAPACCRSPRELEAFTTTQGARQVKESPLRHARQGLPISVHLPVGRSRSEPCLLRESKRIIAQDTQRSPGHEDVFSRPSWRAPRARSRGAPLADRRGRRRRSAARGHISIRPSSCLRARSKRRQDRDPPSRRTAVCSARSAPTSRLAFRVRFDMRPHKRSLLPVGQ